MEPDLEIKHELGLNYPLYWELKTLQVLEPGRFSQPPGVQLSQLFDTEPKHFKINFKFENNWIISREENGGAFSSKPPFIAWHLRFDCIKGYSDQDWIFGYPSSALWKFIIFN